jgi:hypothetical protein
MKKILFTLITFLVFCTSAMATDYFPSTKCTDQGSTAAGCTKSILNSIGVSKNATLKFQHSSNSNSTTYTFTTPTVIPANVRVDMDYGVVLAGTVSYTNVSSGNVATDSIFSASGDLVQGTGSGSAAKLTKGAAGTLLRAGASLNAYSGFTIADTFGKGTIPYASATNTITALPHPGAANYFLYTNGADTNSWLLGTKLVAINTLANSAGALINNGAGNFSYGASGTTVNPGGTGYLFCTYAGGACTFTPVTGTTGMLWADGTVKTSLSIASIDLTTADHSTPWPVGAANPVLNYTFTVTAASATAGAVYSNNSASFTVAATISGLTSMTTVGSGAPAASGTLTLVSGTGDATITFSANTPVYVQGRAAYHTSEYLIIEGASAFRYVPTFAAAGIGLVGTASQTYTFPSASATLAKVTSQAFVTPDIGAATGTSLLLTGRIDGTVNVVTSTANAATSISSTNNKSAYYLNIGDSDAHSIYTLPTPAATGGCQYCVTNYTGITTKISLQAPANVILVLDGAAGSAAGHAIMGGALGDSICAVGVDATHYLLHIGKGTATLAGP